MVIEPKDIQPIWNTKDISTKRTLMGNLLDKCDQTSFTIQKMKKELPYATNYKIDQMATGLLMYEENLKVLRV